MNKKIRMLPVVILASLMILVVGSCSDSDGNLLGTGQGQLTVSIHDQAAPQLSEVWVTFAGIEVRNAEGQWVDLGLDLSSEIDILSYVGSSNAVDLATSPVEPGTYNAVRVSIYSVRVVMDDGSEVNFVGGWQVVVSTGLEVVDEDGSRSIVLHFDVDASFQVQGTSLVFDPAITLSN